MGDAYGNLNREVLGLDPDDPLRRLILRFVGQEKRARLHRAHSLPSQPSTAEKLNKKRHARAQGRKAQTAVTGTKHVPLRKEILAFRFRESPVLSRLWPARSQEWLQLHRRRRDASQSVISIPQLSFIADPVGALEAIVQIARAEAKHLDVRVDFNFDYVEDLGPFLVLSEIWPQFAPVFAGGGSMAPAVQKVVTALDLSSSMDMAFPHLRDLKDVWAMPVQRRRARGTSGSITRYVEPQSHEAVATRLCDELDSWMATAGAECCLTEEGRANLSLIVGELLDNAERHSSVADKDGSWTVAAFMARREVKGELRHVCHLAFLSLGDTISQSLDATAPDQIRDQLDGFVKRQRDCGATQERATLLTLAALQDGVTRDPEAVKRESGGTGLMEFIQTVNILALSDQLHFKPEMAIISGRSCIILKDPYLMGKTDGNENRRLMFNPGNSPSDPASDSHVFDLPIEFPGTVISVAFTLDPEYYRRVLNGTDTAE